MRMCQEWAKEAGSRTPASQENVEVVPTGS